MKTGAKRAFYKMKKLRIEHCSHDELFRQMAIEFCALHSFRVEPNFLAEIRQNKFLGYNNCSRCVEDLQKQQFLLKSWKNSNRFCKLYNQKLQRLLFHKDKTHTHFPTNKTLFTSIFHYIRI